MTRAQATFLSALLGLVLLVFMGFILIFFIPIDNPFAEAPTATVTFIPPPLPTATFPNFMPTPSNETPIIEPSPTNTRLPTSTPSPVRTDTPTVVVTINFVSPRRTATPTQMPGQTPFPPTVTPTPDPQDPTATLPLQFEVRFNARNPSIQEGDCTFLEWRVTGSNNIQLDGQSVPATGRQEVCPVKNVTYQLRIQLPDGNSFTRSTTVSVR